VPKLSASVSPAWMLAVQSAASAKRAQVVLASTVRSQPLHTA